jgi:hypothetical protein
MTFRNLQALLILALFACRQPTSVVPEIGETLPAPAQDIFALGQGEHLIGAKQIHGNVTYFIGMTVSGEVTGIATIDAKFRSPEGFTITSTLAEITKTISSPIRYQFNGTSSIELPSGWVAVFLNPENRGVPATATPIRFCRYKSRLTLRSSRTPPALPSALSQQFANSASFTVPVQAWPLSFIR